MFFSLNRLAYVVFLCVVLLDRYIDKITSRVTVWHVGSVRSPDQHVRRRLDVMKELSTMQ